MAISKIRTIINAVELMRPQPGGHVFNDKLADGTRSIKVWGWTSADYDNAKAALEKAEFKVQKKVFTTLYQGTPCNVIRLLVSE